MIPNVDGIIDALTSIKDKNTASLVLGSYMEDLTNYTDDLDAISNDNFQIPKFFINKSEPLTKKVNIQLYNIFANFGLLLLWLSGTGNKKQIILSNIGKKLKKSGI